jgi:hypothetical protein
MDQNPATLTLDELSFQEYMGLWGQVIGADRAFKENRPVDMDGKVLPWLTYAAIDYLSGLDMRTWKIFEYGAGYSSLWFAGRCQQVWSVEDSREWMDILKKEQLPNQTLYFEEQTEPYWSSIKFPGTTFDLVLVDGNGNKNRRIMAEHAAQYLKPGGAILLDNADVHVHAAASLRSLGFIQIDFFGLTPAVKFANCTSLFLTAAFRPQPLGGVQPRKHILSLHHLMED